MEEDGYVRRQQSDDLMLVQEGGTFGGDIAFDGDNLTSEEQLTPLAERESDMDEMSNGDNANIIKHTHRGKLMRSSIANNSKIMTSTKKAQQDAQKAE